jgi:hypothetical protein
MTDIFFSYKKEDGARVEPIARALAQAGYDVWWDHRIPPGRTYREVIGAALQSAKCVIVVWSNLSASAQWVLDEADEGKKRGVLLPLMIDDVEIPYGFRQIEAARLVDWNGDTKHPEWLSAISAVAALVGRAPGGPPREFASVSHVAPRAAPSATSQAAVRKSGGSIVGPVIGVVAVAALLGGGYYAWDQGFLGGAPAAEEATTEAPVDEAPAETAGDTRQPVVVAGDPLATFFESGYAYCDAKLVAAFWKTSDIGQTKTDIGGKLTNGLMDELRGALEGGRAMGVTCDYEEAGYQFADAEKLAGIWGLADPYAAKMKIGLLATNGEREVIERALGG